MSRKVEVDWEAVERDLGGKDFTDMELANMAGVLKQHSPKRSKQNANAKKDRTESRDRHWA